MFMFHITLIHVLYNSSSKYFHLKVNSRPRKKFIPRLQRDQGWAISHEEKEEVAPQHFSSVLGQPPSRTMDFSWNILGINQVDLQSLDIPFTEQEVVQAIKQMPHDKAPGPDGFTMAFFCCLLGHHQK
jgi:hypothetical protein